ncbi:hypothetical protein BGZ83_001933 [Gryganskiella cystojenkinii]|nr:hypothetical protein BGZ83_001933 [Gryganskiella cystojenkinii]
MSETGSHQHHHHDSASVSATVSGASTPASSASSSLSSGPQTNSNSNNPLTRILVLYHKATSTFLLRQLAAAYSTSLEALELLSRTNQDYGLDHSEDISTRRSFFVLKQKLWVLNATIFGAMLTDQQTAGTDPKSGGGLGGIMRRTWTSSSKESPEKLVRDLWRRLVDDYGGVSGDVDGQVMVPIALLCINQKLYTLARQITEDYLVTIPEGMLIHLETAAGALTTRPAESGVKDPLMINYERLVELYVVHALAKLGDWDAARDFLDCNTVLSESSKKSYGKILDKLHQKSLRPKKSVVKKPTATVATTASTMTSISMPSSTASTLVSSPTLPAESVLPTSSPTSAHILDSKTIPSKAADSSRSSPLPGTGTRSGRTKMKSANNGSEASSSDQVANTKTTAATAVSTATVQGRLWILVQHYKELIRNAGANIGPNQLMVIVGLVVFLGTLARNRAKVSKVMTTVIDKLKQTVKMGTTVTSI